MKNSNHRIKFHWTWQNKTNTIKNLRIHELTLISPMESISFSKTKINSISLIIKTFNNKILTYLSNLRLLSNTRNQFPPKIWPESTKINPSQKESNKDLFLTPQMKFKTLSILITFSPIKALTKNINNINFINKN